MAGDETEERTERERFEAEVRGRLACQETILLAFMAHMAAHTSDPKMFIGQIMLDAEQSLARAGKAATDRDDTEAAAFATEAFARISEQMLNHLMRHMAGGRAN